AWGDVAVDAANFPDSVFRQYVSDNFDKDGNGYLSDGEIAGATRIEEIDSKGISSLKGVEYFTALKYLDCNSNQLIKLDVSHNTDLTYLRCDSQTREGLILTSSGNPSYPYQLNFTGYMTSAQTANVSNVKGLDSSSADIATTYSDGVAMFASKPSAVKYNYTTGYSVRKMDVTITEGAVQAKPAITTSSLPNATVGTSYTQVLTASGTAPITWTHTSGKLPDGITLSSDGTISGTPSLAGSCTFTVKASNSAGDDSKRLTLKITNPPDWTAPAITTTTLNPAAIGKPYTARLDATGNPAPTWRIASGTLPAGLILSADGSISGTPTRAGSFKITVIAENAVGYAQRKLTLKSQIVPTITTTGLKSATTGQSYSGTVIASGTTPLTWSADGLPAGLTFKDCTIRGKARTKGTYPVTVTVSNSAGTDTKTLSLDVHAVMPVFKTSSLPVGTWNKRYSATITMKKGTKPITLELAGTLPDGLGFDADAGTITGTPNETCNALVLTFTDTNAEGSVSKDFTLTVNGVKPKITTSSLPQAVKGRDYSADVAATGNAPITWRAVNLPAGLSLDADTGTISGTPEEACKGYITVRAENSGGSHAKRVRLLIREDRTAKKSSLPEERTPEIPDDEHKSSLPVDDMAGRSTMPENSAGFAGGYVIVAELGTVSADEAGMYDFTVTLSDDSHAGAELVYLANSDTPSDDDGIAEFFDADGGPVSTVPDEQTFTVSVWLNPEIVYAPVIAVKY
ncbi:MAG: putative Ig domain-containing protein, partial [Synergistaceae bacterium]|nr:putative Ig domain-containing protein [Synergistaceae bacterium]